jgi:hypothetical protein
MSQGCLTHVQEEISTPYGCHSSLLSRESAEVLDLLCPWFANVLLKLRQREKLFYT